MDIERSITIKDFLSLKSISEGGTLIDGRRYAVSKEGKLSPSEQLKMLGKLDRTGEGVMDKVFFFETLVILKEESYGDTPVSHQLISAKIVDRYKYNCKQEACKEIALINAKIKLKEKDRRGENDEEK